MASGQPQTSVPPKFAKRRPDWELPGLHDDLEISDHTVLSELGGRSPCPKCNKSRSFYCYDCLVPFTDTPSVTLPCKFSIITHKDERLSMNTGVHAAILAPAQVQLHDIEQCPAFDKARAVVLFPSDDALEVAELAPGTIDRAFIIDSKWKAARKILMHPNLQGVRCVKLSNTRSSFWRFHTKGVSDEGVCTIEAMYFFLESLAAQGKLSDSAFKTAHAFDNLLWYFTYQHKIISESASNKMERRRQAEEQPKEPGQDEAAGASPGGGAAKRRKEGNDA